MCFLEGSGKRLEDFNYKDVEMRKIMFDSMKNVSFQGIRGKIKFDDKGDNIALVKILQYQGQFVWQLPVQSQNAKTDQPSFSRHAF